MCIRDSLEIKRICHEHKVPLIINDNVQFAIDIAADGVHLGQDDMNPAEARKLLGTDKIIGVTAKTVEQAKRAEADGADYLGCLLYTSGLYSGDGVREAYQCGG